MLEPRPATWPKKKLGDLFRIETMGCVPAEAPRDLFRHYSLPAFDETGGPAIEQGQAIESNKLLLTEACVLVSKLNPRIPRVTVYRPVGDGLPVCASTEFIPYIATSAEALLDFYARYFGSEYFRKQLERVATGTTNSHVRLRPHETLKWEVHHPSPDEQRAIADILNAVDTAIERTGTAIEKAETLRHALLQRLPTCGVNNCGVLRDPSTQPEQFVKSSVGLIPKGWTLRTLRNVGKWMSGGTPSKADWGYWQGSIPWVSPKDMKTFLLYDTIDHVSEQGVRDGSQLVDAGTVFIVVRGMILAHTFPVAVAMRPMAFNQDMKGIACNGLVSPMYLAYWFTAQARRLLTLTSETSHGTKRLDTRLIWRFPIAVPPPDEQERMVNLLEVSDSQINAYRQVEAKQQRLKRGLMQDLLTGKVRVPVTAMMDPKTMATLQPA